MDNKNLTLEKIELNVLKHQSQYKDFINKFGNIQKLTLSNRYNLINSNFNFFANFINHVKDNKKIKQMLFN